MKRILACLLILLLPFQSAWAVAGAFCGEAGTSVMVGTELPAHHEHHEHTPAGADIADQDLTACAAMDGHCAACHLGCCVGNTPMAQQASNDADAPVFLPRTYLPSPASQRPERPKWPALA